MDLTPTAELEAINEIIAALGESPVETLEDTGSAEVESAIARLRMTSRQVQEKGWHWNTAFTTLPLTIDTGEVFVPANTLKADTIGEHQCIDAVLRGRRLFDRQNNTYRFKHALKVTLVQFLPFDELPEAGRQYITMAAKRQFQVDFVGDPSKAQPAGRDEMMAWAALRDAEAETQDANMFTGSWSVMEVLAR